MPQPNPSRARQRIADTPATSGPTESASWVQDHLDAVYRYARRRLSATDAEDVTQQSFAALFRAQADGRAPDDPGAYLLGVARRRVADHWRSRHRRPPPVSLPEGWEGYGEVELPGAALETAELRALVQTALGFLRGEDAALLQARYREGASTVELAERLALTPKAVENRLRRARVAFLQHLRAVGADWVDERPFGPKGVRS